MTFKCVRGISCSCDKSGSHAKLRFFGKGKVITTTSAKYASIGGDNKEVNGIIELHGPTVEANGGGYSAAIGGGYSEMDPDSAGERSCIKIYAGIIRANYDEVCNLTDDVVTPAVTAADINWPWLAEENDNLSLSENEGIFVGATLSLKSETTLSFYFKFVDPNKTRDFTVGNPNYTIEFKNTDPYTIVRVRGIKSKDLGNNIELEWKDGLVKYSPMNYCYNVVSGNYDENLKNVCKALYLYWQKAAAYFSKS